MLSSFHFWTASRKFLTLLFDTAPSSSQPNQSLGQLSNAGAPGNPLSAVFAVAGFLEEAWAVVPRAPPPPKSSAIGWQPLEALQYVLLYSKSYRDRLPNPNNRCSYKVWFAQQSSKVFKFAYRLPITEGELQKIPPQQNHTAPEYTHTASSHVFPTRIRAAWESKPLEPRRSLAKAGSIRGSQSALEIQGISVLGDLKKRKKNLPWRNDPTPLWPHAKET